jgi:BolA protein
VSADVAQAIRAALEAALGPSHLTIRDDSALHAGHAGAREGGHYHVTIATERFRGLAPLARHRLVYDALAMLMPGRIHALSIDAFLPDNPPP